MYRYAEEAVPRGIEVIIAGAGGAAHLPGMVAAKTDIPVIGVPVKTSTLNGLDSLLSIVQMPAGVPVATVAIGKAGAINSALLAAKILGIKYPHIQKKLKERRDLTRQNVLENADLAGYE
jgi:5-(carboxyamino)imidazole ribonucleotide mutase